jgi:hypothetical protein
MRTYIATESTDFAMLIERLIMLIIFFMSIQIVFNTQCFIKTVAASSILAHITISIQRLPAAPRLTIIPQYVCVCTLECV